MYLFVLQNEVRNVGSIIPRFFAVKTKPSVPRTRIPKAVAHRRAAQSSDLKPNTNTTPIIPNKKNPASARG